MEKKEREKLNGKRERKCSSKNKNINRGSEGENWKTKIKMERRQNTRKGVRWELK